MPNFLWENCQNSTAKVLYKRILISDQIYEKKFVDIYQSNFGTILAHSAVTLLLCNLNCIHIDANIFRGHFTIWGGWVDRGGGRTNQCTVMRMQERQGHISNKAGYTVCPIESLYFTISFFCVGPDWLCCLANATSYRDFDSIGDKVKNIEIQFPFLHSAIWPVSIVYSLFFFHLQIIQILAKSKFFLRFEM